MSIYLKTNKKCRLNIMAEILDFISTIQTAFLWLSLFTLANRQNSTAERFVDDLCRSQVERTESSYQA